jgi:hypothetical protein
MNFSHLSRLFAVGGTAVGYLFAGIEGAGFGVFLGYFLGKTIESMWYVVE